MINFGKRFLSNRTRRLVESKTETKDAVVSNLFPSQRLAKVKIQGSDVEIVAHYPLNWQITPTWLKKGNAVKINFVSGNRGRIELIGHGSAIPTVTTPIPATTPGDAILTGGTVFSQSPATMSVDVEAGTVRINGTTYPFAADSVTLDAAPSAGYYRYDLLVVGADGVIDYVKGTQATSDPQVPSVPADHVEIKRILLYNGSTAVYQYMIGQAWTTPAPASLGIVLSATYMEWDIPDDHIHITATVRDQYGQAITPAAAGMTDYDFTLSWALGNGNIDSIPSPTPVTHSGVTTASTDFVYTRNNLGTDEGPTFSIVVDSVPPVSGKTQIELRDADGNPMYGENVGNVSGPDSSVADNLVSFADTSGKVLKDSGIPTERNANLTLFPEYPGAVMTPSGSNNDPGSEGMTSDSEVVSNVRYNYYEWSSDKDTGLQSYDILLPYRVPPNFKGFQAGTNTALTLDIKTEENTTDNNKLDVTINRDGQATTSSLTAQKSSVAATWETIGFDKTDPVLAAVQAGEILDIMIRMYSQNSKYTRIGKVNLQVKLT
jgi:hypothetical protein